MPPKRALKRTFSQVATATATYSCPICYLLLCETKCCANGHSICGFCFKNLVEPALCPICRSPEPWTLANLTLETAIREQFPALYEERILPNLNLPKLETYIRENIDPDYWCLQTQSLTSTNPVRRVKVILALLKLARESREGNQTAVEGLDDTFHYFILNAAQCVWVPKQFSSPQTTQKEQIQKILDTIFIYQTAAYSLLNQTFFVSTVGNDRHCQVRKWGRDAGSGHIMAGFSKGYCGSIPELWHEGAGRLIELVWALEKASGRVDLVGHDVERRENVFGYGLSDVFERRRRI